MLEELKELVCKANLELPKYGCLNIHAALLPKYRGAAPINWAILQGDETVGVTTMMTDKGIDTGDMLLKAETPITEDDTAGTLVGPVGYDLTAAYRIHNRNFFVHNNVGIVGRAVGDGVLAFKQVHLMVVNANVMDIVGNGHRGFSFN